MQFDQRYKTHINHPLRYSEYISKDRLFEHLNDLSIDSADEICQKPIRLNILKFTVPNKDGYFQRQLKQKETMREYSPTRQLYSRENISMMNKKYRQIRMNNYTPGTTAENFNNQNDSGIKYQNNLTNNSDIQKAKTALLTARPKTSMRYENPKIIPEIRGFSSNLQVHNKTQRNFRTAQHQSLRKNINKKQNQLKKQQKGIKVQSGCSFGQYLSKSQIPLPQKVIPNSFKVKIKKKCVQDNLNIMANMIKKKVKILSKDQMYDYINCLMNRHLQKG